MATEFLNDLLLPRDPDEDMMAATKQYVDTHTPPILVLGPATPVPVGTSAGTVIIRTAS